MIAHPEITVVLQGRSLSDPNDPVLGSLVPGLSGDNQVGDTRMQTSSHVGNVVGSGVTSAEMFHLLRLEDSSTRVTGLPYDGEMMRFSLLFTETTPTDTWD